MEDTTEYILSKKLCENRREVRPPTTPFVECRPSCVLELSHTAAHNFDLKAKFAQKAHTHTQVTNTIIYHDRTNANRCNGKDS